MNRRNRTMLMIAVSAIAFTAPTIARAQSGGSNINAQDVATSEDDDIIIVTATRREGTVQDVPINISAVGAEQLEVRGLDNLREVAATVPGVYILDQGNRSGTPIVFRGLNATGLGSFDGNNDGGGAVATYIGDIPLFVDLRLNDVERVEFLLGPQGTLYGAGTLGGAIRYIPVKPKFDAISGEIRGDAYVYASGTGVSTDTGVTINIPLASSVAFRGSIDFANDRGFIDYPYIVRTPGISNPNQISNAANFNPQQDLNTDETLSARAALRFSPSDIFDATLSYHYQDARTEGRQFSQSRLTNFPVAIGRYENALRVREPNRRLTQLVALEAELDLGFAQLVSATGYSDHRERGNRDQTDLLIGLEYSYEQFPAFTALTEERDNSNIFTQELRLVSKFDGPFSFIVGGYYNQLKSDATSTEFTPGYDVFSGGSRPDAIEFISVTNRDLTEFAGFGELSYEITDAWQFTVGGRYYNYDLQTESAIDLPLLETVFNGRTPNDLIVLDFVPANQKDDGFLFKVNTSYKVTNDALLYATVSQGFRVGNSNGLEPCATTGMQQNVCAAPNELEFTPDTTTNYEIGFKTQWLDRKLTLNGAVYYIDWSDPQVASATVVGSSPITINGAGAESKGAEIFGELKITDRLGFRGSYSYTDAQLSGNSPFLLNETIAPGFDTSPVSGLSGDRLPGSPKHQGSFFVDYELPVSAASDLTFSYGFTAHSNVLSRTGSRAGGLVLPGFSTHNASIRLGTENGWSAAVYVNNLFNTFGETGVRGTPRDIQSVTNANGDPVFFRRFGTFVSPPRTLGVRLRKSF